MNFAQRCGVLKLGLGMVEIGGAAKEVVEVVVKKEKKDVKPPTELDKELDHLKAKFVLCMNNKDGGIPMIALEDWMKTDSGALRYVNVFFYLCKWLMLILLTCESTFLQTGGEGG